MSNSGSPSLFNFDTSYDTLKVTKCRRGSSFQSHFKYYRDDPNIKSNDKNLLTPFMLHPIPDKTNVIDGIGKNIANNQEGTVLNTNILTRCEKNFLDNTSNKVVNDECNNDMDTVPEIQETTV